MAYSVCEIKATTEYIESWVTNDMIRYQIKISTKSSL